MRTATLHRDAKHGWVELVDEVTFESGEGTFESVLTSFGKVEIGTKTVRLTVDGVVLDVHYDPAVVVARVEVVKNVDLATGPRDVTRVIFALPVPAKTACVRLCMQAPI